MIYVPRQAHGLETKASRKMSATSPHYQGRQCLNIHLLKPARVLAEMATAEIPGVQQVVGAHQASGSTTLIELHIPSCTGCPRNWLNGLATITEQLSAFRCGTTLQRGRSASSTPSYNLVPGPKGHIRTFGAIQWESELFNGRPKAWCYPFDLPKHRFRGKTLLVKSILYRILHCILYCIHICIQYSMLYSIR